MVPMLKLQFLGAPQIHRDDTPIQDFVTRKALALFIYVATDRRVYLRAKLAAFICWMQEIVRAYRLGF